MRAFAERKGVKLGNVAQPLRAALTGRTTSPPIFDVLAVLGKAESLARLQDQMSSVTADHDWRRSFWNSGCRPPLFLRHAARLPHRGAPRCDILQRTLG